MELGWKMEAGRVAGNEGGSERYYRSDPRRSEFEEIPPPPHSNQRNPPCSYFRDGSGHEGNCRQKGFGPVEGEKKEVEGKRRKRKRKRKRGKGRKNTEEDDEEN